MINPLQPAVAFLYPLKTSENLKVFWCFLGAIEKQHRAVMGWKWLTIFVKNFIIDASQGKSSHRRCYIKKVVLRNFAIFTGKHLCWSLFLIKLKASHAKVWFQWGLQLYSKETLTQVFSYEYCKISKKTYFEKYLWMAASDRAVNTPLEATLYPDNHPKIMMLKSTKRLCRKLKIVSIVPQPWFLTNVPIVYPLKVSASNSIKHILKTDTES